MYKRLTNLLALTLISLPLCAMEKSKEQTAQTQPATQTEQSKQEANSSWLTWKNAGIATGVGLTALAIYGGLHKEIIPATTRVVDGNNIEIAAKTVRGGFTGALKYAAKPFWNWTAVPAYNWVLKPTGKFVAKPFVASWDYAIKPAYVSVSNKLPEMATVKTAISSRLPKASTVKTGAAFVGTGLAGASIKPAYNFVFNGKKEDSKQLLQICADCYAGLVEKKDLDKAQQDALKCTADKELKSLVEKFFIALKADKKSDAQALGIQIREYIKQ